MPNPGSLIPGKGKPRACPLVVQLLHKAKSLRKGRIAPALSVAFIGRGERIRTFDPLLPKQMRYQAAPRPDEPQV